MSKIIEKGPTCFLKTSPEKKHTQFKNALVAAVAFNTELHSRKIIVPEHQ